MFVSERLLRIGDRVSRRGKPTARGYNWVTLFMLAFQDAEMTNLGEYDLVLSPVGLGDENDCAGEALQQP
jgi:hypothetical protein